jgi:hypothetical protein
MQTTWSGSEKNAKLFLRGNDANPKTSSDQQPAQGHPDCFLPTGPFSPKMANKWQ